jgi:DNA invertase Pin-like site-specific DNA recombinase
VVEVYADEDRSAYRPGVSRESYERLLRDAVSHRFDAILVWRLDRLARSPSDFERLWSLCRTSGVALVSATEPVDSSDPVGVAVIRLLVTFAGLESDVRSIRLKAKNREVAEAGLAPWGPRRFRYSAGFTEVVEEEAALIREAAHRVLHGESPTAITREWRARGVDTPITRQHTEMGRSERRSAMKV